MDKLKDILSMVAHGRLSVYGKGRTFARVPLFLVVLAVLAGGGRSVRFALLTAVLIVAFGMKVQVERS